MRLLCFQVEYPPSRNPGFHAQDNLRVRRTGLFDGIDEKAQKRPSLGRFDASRTETHRSVFGPRKREKTAFLTVGDKLSPDAPYGVAHLRAWKRTHETRIHGIQWISWIFSGKRAFARVRLSSTLARKCIIHGGYPRPSGISPKYPQI